MANAGRTPEPRSRWTVWLAVALPALLWAGLALTLQPAGLVQTAAVIAVAVVLGACAVLMVVLHQGRSALIPVRAQVRRTPSRPRLWDADAPGRPRSRAPADGCFRAAH